MEKVDWAFIIAIYGAFLSTVGIGIKLWEFKKEKRQLTIFLENLLFYETYRLRLVNSGHRPINIREIGMYIIQRNENEIVLDEAVPRKSMFDREVNFPIGLTDGMEISLPLSPVLNYELKKADSTLYIIVRDSEGNNFTNFQKTSYNPKWEDKKIRKR